MSDFILNYARKAAAAFLATGLGAIGVALIDGGITVPESLGALGAALVAAGAVFKATNKPQE